jgi:hypothetical protein
MILQIIEKMNQGGAVFTYPILATSIAVTIYFIKALRNNLRINGLAKLIASYGWFVFAWGSLGSAFGLIVAFDTLKTKTISTLTAQELAGGFRMVLLCSLFAAFVFSLSRIYIVILNTIENKRK